MTIISNNCWGTYVYQRLGIPYASPLVNTRMATADFLRLAANLRHYLAQPLTFAPHSRHAYVNALREQYRNYYPIGILGDVEVQFLHYASAEESAAKWARRLQRVDHDRLVWKFDDTDHATTEQLAEFMALPYPRKVCFVGLTLPEQPLDAGLIWHAGL